MYYGSEKGQTILLWGTWQSEQLASHLTEWLHQWHVLIVPEN